MMRIRQLPVTTLAGIVLGMIALGLAFAVVWQWIQTSRLSSAVKADRATLAKLSGQADAGKSAVEDYDKLSIILGGRYKEVSWGRQMPFMINQLSGILQSQGIRMEGLRPEPMTTADSIARLPLRISIKTGLKDLAEVLEDVERTVPLLDVEKLNIRASDAKSSLLEADMTVSSFAVIDENAAEVERPTAKQEGAKSADSKTGSDEKSAKVADANASGIETESHRGSSL